MFRLDAFQKTMKTEKYVNEWPGLLENKDCRSSHNFTKNFSVEGFSPRLTNCLLGHGENRQPAYRSGKKASEITQNDHAITAESKLFHVYDFDSNLKINRLISGICRLKNYLSCLQIELTER